MGHEKFNFEDFIAMQRCTVNVHATRTLHVSAQDEMVIIEHADLFRKSGFDIEIDENAMGKRKDMRLSIVWVQRCVLRILTSTHQFCGLDVREG